MFGFFKKNQKDLNDAERETFNNWLVKNGLGRDANYSLYRDMPLTRSDNAVCIIGVSRPLEGGNHEGFCIEIYDGKTVRHGGVIFAGIAARSRELGFASKTRRVALVDLAIQENDRRNNE